MAQLNDFTGGLSTRVHPGYVGPTEGIIYTNIDPGRGTIKAMYANKLEETTTFSNLYIFKGNKIFTNDKRDYVELTRKLYYTDGIGRPQKSSDGKVFHNLGISARDVAPTIAEGTTGVITGTIQYCYTYYNANDGTESIPSPYSQELVVSNKSIVIKTLDNQIVLIQIYEYLKGALYSRMTWIKKEYRKPKYTIEFYNADSAYIEQLNIQNKQIRCYFWVDTSIKNYKITLKLGATLDGLTSNIFVYKK